MTRRATWARRVGRIASMTVLVAVVFAIVTHWPMAFGGSTQLVWVSGDSMEPTYQARDLVVVRAADDYGVGDVVMYPIPNGRAGEGILIIHRIVGILDGGVPDDAAPPRYVTRGDNRASDDPWEPTTDDIVGAVAYRVPFGPISPAWVMVALSPMVLAMVLGALAAALVWSWLSPTPRRVPPVTDPGAGAWPAPQPRCANSPTACAGSPTHCSSPSIRPDAPDRR